MSDKKFDLLDYLLVLVKNKRIIIATVLPSMIIFYLAVYFLVDEKFDASATIIPVEESSLSGIAGMLKDLPIDIGGVGGMSTELSRYNTIIYSRSVLDKVINKFDLINVYEISRSSKAFYKKTLKTLYDNISASDDENGAYQIKVRDKDPKRAAEITNYLIQLLNDKIVEMKIQKSTENRKFLEGRLLEIKTNLAQSEDSLKLFQKTSGLLSAEDQIKEILQANAKLETDLLTQQVELSILEKIKDKNSPEVQNTRIKVDELEKKVTQIKNNGVTNSLFLGLNNLPDKAIDYFRLVRNIEINNAILQFVLPLYEQSKFEEQKDTPILQVVDYAIPPEEKSFPPRSLLTLVWGIVIFFLTYLLMLIRENPYFNNNPQLISIKKNLFKW